MLRWNDVELQLGPLVEGGGGGSSPGRRVETRWDWNGDGRPDVTVNGQVTHPSLSMHPNLGTDGIGDRVLLRKSPPIEPPSGFLGARGFALIDVDADGIPELLISTTVDGYGDANPVEDLVLMRRRGTAPEHWEQAGEAFRWGPCGALIAHAVGDFDGDGDEDIAVLDHGQSCDPYPSTYDPEWYRVYVLLSNAEEGVLELGGWYPTGGVVKEPILWAEDVTGDGHLDLLLEIGDPLAYGVAVMRGRGDGTFEAGAPVDLSPNLPVYNARALIDVDGDGTQEWIVTVVEGRPWVIPFDFSTDGIAPMVALNDPEAGGYTRFHEPVGDINGDGVDDYTVGTHLEDSWSPYMGRFLMVSAP